MKKKQSKTKSSLNNKSQKNGSIRPLGSRILIRPFTKEEISQKNRFGIILPEQSSKEKSERGVVLAVGPGDYIDGVFVSMKIKVGDKVIFSKYGFDEVNVEGSELYLIKEENILAVINK